MTAICRIGQGGLRPAGCTVAGAGECGGRVERSPLARRGHERREPSEGGWGMWSEGEELMRGSEMKLEGQTFDGVYSFEHAVYPCKQ